MTDAGRFVVDASVWVARFLPNDSHHTVSRDWLASAVSDDAVLLIPNLALIETAGAISRRLSQPVPGLTAVRLIARVPGVVELPLDTEMRTHATALAAEQRLRGADAVYVAVARIYQATLVTLDVELLSRASAVVAALLPSSSA